MRINHNLASLNTYKQLVSNQATSSKSLEKLSSGLRINRAGDDAAGLAISEKMRGQIRGLDQAGRNSQDAISLIQTAEGALNETHSILQRMRELAVQSANDTATSSDRGAIQDEVNQLVSEIDRIGNNTEFNTKKLLNGSAATRTASSNEVTLSGVSTTADTQSGVYAVDFTAAATKGTITGVVACSKAPATGISCNQTVAINGTQISFNGGDSIGDVAAKINNYSATTGVKAIVTTGGIDCTGQYLKLETAEYGSSKTVSIQNMTSGKYLDNLGLTACTTLSSTGTDAVGTIDGCNAIGSGNTLSLSGTTDVAEGLKVQANVVECAASVTLSGVSIGTTTCSVVLKLNGACMTFSQGTAYSVANVVDTINSYSADTGVKASYSGTSITLASNAVGDSAQIYYTASGGCANGLGTGLCTTGACGGSSTGTDGIDTATNDGTITVNKDSVLKMHIGANANQNMEVSINDMRSAALKVNNVDVTTQSSANSAITTINTAIEKVSTERSKLGAYQNRLEHSINNLSTSSENLTAAESRIRDVDMAKEMMEFNKNNILMQAAQSMLAQANQQPQGVLSLLS